MSEEALDDELLALAELEDDEDPGTAAGDAGAAAPQTASQVPNSAVHAFLVRAWMCCTDTGGPGGGEIRGATMADFPAGAQSWCLSKW